MRAVGLHFGHDASGAVVDDDGVRLFLDKERRSRVKHAIGLSTDDLRELLTDAPDDTRVGLASTQHVPLMSDEVGAITVAGAIDYPAADYFAKIADSHFYRRLVGWHPQPMARAGIYLEEQGFPHYSRTNKDFNRSYEALAMVGAQVQTLHAAMRREATLRLDGRTFGGTYYQHHFLHAVYAGWTSSPGAPALVITQDAGDGPSFKGGGIYFWRPGEALRAVTPVDGWIGRFYNQVAEQLGFDENGGAGKLMGLAPYGRPIHVDHTLVGTRWQVSDGYRLSYASIFARWLERFGLTVADIPAWDPFTDRPPALVADLAASAQLIVELNMQAVARAAIAIADRAGFEFEAVVLAGGVALNCPANSNLAVTLGRPVLVPPAVNDEGLSIGAAVAAFFDAAGRYPRGPRDYAEAAYIGAGLTEAKVRGAAARHDWALVEGDALENAARLILADTPIGLCVGRSEAGPRALGHRSILANPASAEAWGAMNRLKRREPWRPFAPAVLLERSADYFDRGPDESRYMLFNYRCNTKALPAITHYDHSARVQHVSAATGLLYALLQKLESLGAPPVVLNTSFNGPGTPIVDTAEDAFAEAAILGLTHILTDHGLWRAP